MPAWPPHRSTQNGNTLQAYVRICIDQKKILSWDLLRAPQRFPGLRSQVNPELPPRYFDLRNVMNLDEEARTTSSWTRLLVRGTSVAMGGSIWGAGQLCSPLILLDTNRVRHLPHYVSMGGFSAFTPNFGNLVEPGGTVPNPAS